MEYKAVDADTAESRLYGNIGSWFVSGDEFAQLTDTLEQRGFKRLQLRLHSYGGSVFEGNAIYNAMRKSSLHIEAVIEGVAASMACMILPAADEVSICENAFGMIHRPYSFAEGNADDHEAAAKLLRNMEEQFIKVLSLRSHQDAESIRAKWFDGSDHWLNAEEMVRFGLADTIIPALDTNEQIEKQEIEKLEAEEAYHRYVALVAPQKPKKNTMEAKELIQSLGLEGLSPESSEADILSAAKAAIDRGKAAEEQHRKTVKDLVNAAIREGKVGEDNRELYEYIGMNKGIEAMNKLFSDATPDLKKAVSRSKTDKTDKTWDWYQEHDVRALEKMEKEAPEEFTRLYNQKYK